MLNEQQVSLYDTMHHDLAHYLPSATQVEDVDSPYCLVASQDWVGNDIVRPDCTVDSSDPSCSDPTAVAPDNERLANLYGDDVLSPNVTTSGVVPR